MNYELLLHGTHLQLCTLTIYGNMVIVKHVHYFKKSIKIQIWRLTVLISHKTNKYHVELYPLTVL